MIYSVTAYQRNQAWRARARVRFRKNAIATNERNLQQRPYRAMRWYYNEEIYSRSRNSPLFTTSSSCAPKIETRAKPYNHEACARSCTRVPSWYKYSSIHAPRPHAKVASILWLYPLSQTSYEHERNERKKKEGERRWGMKCDLRAIDESFVWLTPRRQAAFCSTQWTKLIIKYRG